MVSSPDLQRIRERNGSSINITRYNIFLLFGKSFPRNGHFTVLEKMILRPSLVIYFLIFSFSQEKLLQQLRAEKKRLQQSKSSQMAKLMSGGLSQVTTAPPYTQDPLLRQLSQHPGLDHFQLEAPAQDQQTSMDKLVARLERLEERRSEVGVMTVREDGSMCVVKVSFYN